MLALEKRKNSPSIFADDFWDSWLNSKMLATPAMANVRSVKTDLSYTFFVDLPGVKKEDIDVSLENGNFAVSAKRYDRKDVVHTYYANVGLEWNEDDVDASLQDGVLKVVLTRRGPPQKGRKIEVK